MRENWRQIIKDKYGVNHSNICHIGMLFWEHCSNFDCFNCEHYYVARATGFNGNVKEFYDLQNGDRMENYIIEPASEDYVENYLYHGLKGFVGGQKYIGVILKANKPQKRKANEW